MSFRSRLLIAFALATIVPLAMLAFGVRRQLTARLVAQHERRVQLLANVAAYRGYGASRAMTRHRIAEQEH